MKNLARFLCYLLAVVHLFTITAYAAEEIHFFHTDPAGTPLSITDINGAVVWEADYKPFGEEYSVTSSSLSNDRRFVGKEKDGETGFHYFDARYMDSRVGRFTSPDPVGPVDSFFSEVNYSLLTNPQRLNPYAYGLNNPYRYVDPDGNIVWDIVDFGFFGYSLYNFAKDPSWSTGAELGLDTIGLLPLLPSLGLMRAAGKGFGKADDAIGAARKLLRMAPGKHFSGQQLRNIFARIGRPSRGKNVREVVGSSKDAKSLFKVLSSKGVPFKSKYPGEMIRLPDGTRVGFRMKSTSGPPTIDVHYPGKKLKIKFLDR